MDLKTSADTDKAFGSPSSTMKTFCKLRAEGTTGMYLDGMKATYTEPIANTVLSPHEQRLFLLDEDRARAPILSVPVLTVLMA